MNKKTIISLSVAAALIGVTVWYLRQLSAQLRLMEPDTTDDEAGPQLYNNLLNEAFLARYPVRKNPTEAEAKRLLDEAKEILRNDDDMADSAVRTMTAKQAYDFEHRND